MRKLLAFLAIIGIALTIITGMNYIGHGNNPSIPYKTDYKGSSGYTPPISGGLEKVENDSSRLAVDAPNAVLIDCESGNILYDKAAEKRCFPASTTKILTALLALENGDLNEVVTVGEEANLAPLDSSKAGICYGERFTLETLLKCLLIPSGNDAAYVIAVHIARKVSRDGDMPVGQAVNYFCRLMNERAVKAGATESNFANPDGYHREDHYTTARDIALIAREAMEFTAFRDIVKMENYSLPDIKLRGNDGKMQNHTRLLLNTNKLIIRDSSYFFKYAAGVKTGHTGEAGYCLVSSALYEGKSVIAAVMNSTEENVWPESVKLLEWGLFNAGQ